MYESSFMQIMKVNVMILNSYLKYIRFDITDLRTIKRIHKLSWIFKTNVLGYGFDLKKKEQRREMPRFSEVCQSYKYVYLNMIILY